jgi:hypothetical protein
MPQDLCPERDDAAIITSRRSGRANVALGGAGYDVCGGRPVRSSGLLECLSRPPASRRSSAWRNPRGRFHVQNPADSLSLSYLYLAHRIVSIQEFLEVIVANLHRSTMAFDPFSDPVTQSYYADNIEMQTLSAHDEDSTTAKLHYDTGRLSNVIVQTQRLTNKVDWNESVLFASGYIENSFSRGNRPFAVPNQAAFPT